jgi:hypothetical protein
VLDQLSDTDSVPRKLSAKPGDVAAPARHPAQGELEAYSNGRLAAARLDFCRTHLESCDACRAELEDIRTLQTTLAAFPRPDANRFESNRRRRGGLALPITISAVAILVATGGIFFWWPHGTLPARKLSVAAPVARIPTPSPAPDGPAAPTTPARKLSFAALFARAPTPPAPLAAPAAQAMLAMPATAATPAPLAATNTQPRNTHLAAAPAAHATAETLAPPAATNTEPRNAHPATPPAAPPPTNTQPRDARLVAAPPSAPTGFSLLSPSTETTPEPRPQFKWQPLAGAIGYKVVIVDTGLHPIQHSPPIRATTWRPHRPLAPGRTYLWQVTATLHGGAQVVATSPTSSPATLRIVPTTQASASGSRSHSHTR